MNSDRGSWITGVNPKGPAKPALSHQKKQNVLHDILEYFPQVFCRLLS